MIIVDGPDNVGKTTFIKQLAKLLEFNVRSFGPEIADVSPEQLINEVYVDCSDNNQINYSEHPNKWRVNPDELEASDVIYDRFHMSNFVYGKVIRKSNKVTANDARSINRHLRARKLAYTILILPANISEYERNLVNSNRNQEYNIAQNVAIAEQFNLHATYLEPNEIMYVNQHPFSNEAKHIVAQYCSWRGIHDPLNPPDEADSSEDSTYIEEPGVGHSGDSEEDS